MHMFALLAVIAAAGQNLAHDFYLIPVLFIVENGDLITVGLRNGDSFPESEISPVLERVRDMKLISPSGAVDVQNLHADGKEVQGEVRSRWPDFCIWDEKTFFANGRRLVTIQGHWFRFEALFSINHNLDKSELKPNSKELSLTPTGDLA
jgi:hypothetical protein